MLPREGSWIRIPLSLSNFSISAGKFIFYRYFIQIQLDQNVEKSLYREMAQNTTVQIGDSYYFTRDNQN